MAKTLLRSILLLIICAVVIFSAYAENEEKNNVTHESAETDDLLI